MNLISAELIKLASQRAALFWGFIALPLLLTLIAIVLDGSLQPGSAAVRIYPVRTVLRTLGAAGNPVVQLFFAMGAAALFALEYRHAGWRLIVPRRARAALLTAKLAAFAIAATLSLVLLCAGNLASIWLVPSVMGARPFALEPVSAGAVAIMLVFLVSLVQLLGLAALVASLAVATRSTIGAILPPFMLVLISSATQAYFAGPPGSMLALPGAAPDLLRAAIAAPYDRAISFGSGEVTLALAVTAAWFVLPWAAALLLFARQDLASE